LELLVSLPGVHWGDVWDVGSCEPSQWPGR
jgi:hypothetical protein